MTYVSDAKITAATQAFVSINGLHLPVKQQQKLAILAKSVWRNKKPVSLFLLHKQLFPECTESGTYRQSYLLKLGD